MADLILGSNNAKFMDNAPLFLCHRTKGQSYWWKFLLFFTNQPFDIQIVCLPGIFRCDSISRSGGPWSHDDDGYFKSIDIDTLLTNLK